MNKQTKTFLKTINFSDTIYWDVKRYLSSELFSDFDIIPLSELIVERNQKVKLFDYPKERFRILGVNNKIGLFDAYSKYGENINQPYKKVLDGDLAYNPYRINVGSIGRKTKSQKNDFISPAYVVFSSNEKLLSEFLYILFKTDSFNKIIKNNTTGAVRQNLKFETLSNIKIPLPPISKQRQMLDANNRTIQLAKKQEEQAGELQKEIEKYILEVLRIENSDRKENQKGLQLVSYKDLDRWSVDYTLKMSSLSKHSSRKYPNIKLKDFMLSYQYGLSLKSHKKPAGVPMLRMNNIFDSKVVLDDVKYINIDEDVKQKYLLAEGDLLFNRTNSKELVGKTAVFDKVGDYTFASYLIRVKLDSTKVNVCYINYLFNSSLLEFQKDMTSRQILGQANINSKELQDFIFPLPPLQIQNQMAKKIDHMHTKIKNLQQQAKTNREKAIREFEAEVFSKK